MRISHTQLLACEASPHGWFRAATGPKVGRRTGYDQLVRGAIYHLHRTGSAAAAAKRLQEALQSAKLTDPHRLASAADSLTAYHNWHAASGVNTAECRVRISFDVGFLVLGGEVSRVDLRDDGYAGILLGKHSADWREETRMPLIQLALAARYGRDAAEFQVGVQNLNGSGLETALYTATERTAALAAFERLARNVKRLAGGY